MSCQSTKHRQSRTKAGEMQPAWFQEKFHPGCTAWLDPEGRDRGSSSWGAQGLGRTPAQGKHFEQTPQLWPPPLISTSGKLQRDWGRKGRWPHGLTLQLDSHWDPKRPSLIIPRAGDHRAPCGALCWETAHSCSLCSQSTRRVLDGVLNTMWVNSSPNTPVTVSLNSREKRQREVTQLSSGGVQVWREGNDNSLQYSHLERPMDRGAWRATVRQD